MNRRGVELTSMAFSWLLSCPTDSLLEKTLRKTLSNKTQKNVNSSLIDWENSCEGKCCKLDPPSIHTNGFWRLFVLKDHIDDDSKKIFCWVHQGEAFGAEILTDTTAPLIAVDCVNKPRVGTITLQPSPLGNLTLKSRQVTSGICAGCSLSHFVFFSAHCSSVSKSTSDGVRRRR